MVVDLPEGETNDLRKIVHFIDSYFAIAISQQIDNAFKAESHYVYSMPYEDLCSENYARFLKSNSQICVN